MRPPALVYVFACRHGGQTFLWLGLEGRNVNFSLLEKLVVFG
jgi:hypothetical protein